jgi:hypothetical protein
MDERRPGWPTPFTFKIRNAGRGPAIAFFRDGREIKQAGIRRFSVFWDEWCGGKRSADWFTNSGSKKSEAQVARFLIPVFELAERTVGAK